MSSQDRLSRDKSSWNSLSQGRQILMGQVWTHEVKLGQVKSRLVKTGQVNLDQVLSQGMKSQVRTDEVKL